MKHTMHIQSPVLGDETVEWDPHDEREVAKARVKFAKALKKGMLAYAVQDQPSRGEQVREFDPSLTRVILTPALSGG